jgi:hypothetical protein
MKVIRVRMLRTKDQLYAGQYYNLPHHEASELVVPDANGKIYAAWADDLKPVGPSEIKPAGPTEFKPKKKLSRAQTARES